MEKIHCTTCHIPEVYSAPARLKYRDWTVGYFKNQAFRNILDWNFDMVTGSHTPMPVLRGWGSTEEGAKIKPLLPALLPIWNGTIGSTPTPVKNRDVGIAIRAYEDSVGGGAPGYLPNGINTNHGNVYPLFDGFQLGDVVALIDEDNDLFHVVVYLAADLVITKNGMSPVAPWIILPLDEVKRYYGTQTSQPRVIYHRRNDL